MRIFLDDKLLAVQDGENHGNSDRRGIIERVEERNSEKHSFIHSKLEKGLY